MVPLNHSVNVWRRRLATYGFACAVSALTVEVRITLAPWLGERPSLVLFILPVIFSAYVGGFWPGLLSTGICAGGIYFFLLEPRHLLWFEGSVDLWNWVIMILAGVLVSVLIDELRRSRQQAEASSQLNAVTLASIGDGVITTDSDGRVTFLNAEAERLTEWTNAEAHGQPLVDVFRIINESTRQPVESPVTRVLQTGAVVGLANHTILLGKNGHETLIDDSGAPIKKRDGRIIGVVLVFRDGTEKARAQAKLAQSVSLLRTTIEASHDGLLVVDLDRRVTVYNQRFLELWKIPAEIAVQGDERTVLQLGMEQVADPAEFNRVEEVYARPDAGFSNITQFKDGRTVEVVSYPQRLEGKIIGRVWSFRDVTERKNAEAEKSMLAAIVESSDDAIISKTLDDVITSWNRSAERIFGYTATEVIGQSLRQFWPADREEDEQRMLARVALGETFKNIETVRLRKDGKAVTVSATISPIRDAAGKVIGVSKIIRDITEKKLAEEKFAREQARFKLIFDTVPIGIAFHTTYPDGTVTRIINDAHLRIAGLTRAQHDEPGIYTRITHPDDRALQQHFRDQVSAGLRKEYVMEKRYLHADGKVVWVRFSYQRAEYSDGTREELTTVVDLTDRKTVEQQLMQLAVIVESSEDAIISKNLDGVITSWNLGAQNIFGFTTAETLGQPMINFLPTDLQPEETAILARIAHGESIEHFQTERVRKDGKRIRISATISPLRDGQGNVIGSATIARDITRQQLLEEQLRQSQKMEAIGQLAGGVAHDFNNILAVIQMQIELTRIDGNFTPEQAASLDEIQTAAQRGANLTRQLLLFSRRQRLQPRELDLRDSITGMTKMLRRILGEDIQIEFKYASQPLLIHADAGMMDQVLMNLTLNSRDAMPNGGRLIIGMAAAEIDELAASQSAQARPGSFVRLTVSDTGCGIAPEILPRIFEPFFTTKDVGKGTGLGLATVFSIVQQHQGWVNVYSEPGRGTTFNIYLPRLAKAAAPEIATTNTMLTVPRGTETILLVEDDAALRASVRRCLGQLGYRLLEAGNAIAALELWQGHREEIKLLLTDLIMPGGMNGKELGDRLLREKPGLKVVYVSGYSAEIFGKELPEVNGAVFLSKPFPAPLLAQTVRTSLDQK